MNTEPPRIKIEKPVVKIRSLIVALLLASAVTVSAIPLMSLVLQESEKVATEVDDYGRTCSGEKGQQPECVQKRSAVSGHLGEFVALVNEERRFLAEADGKGGEFSTRRKIVDLEIRNALHVIECLDVTSTRCTAEDIEINGEKSALEKEYAAARERWDPKHWIALKMDASSAKDPKSKADR